MIWQIMGVVAVFLLIVILYLLYHWDSSSVALIRHQEYTREEPTNYQFLSLETVLPFDRRNLLLEAQAETWKESMSCLGSKMNAAGVSSTYFVHGTFAGNDPFGFVRMMCRFYPRFPTEWKNKICEQIKRNNDFFTVDMSNYLDEYTDLFQSATGIATTNFHWCSGNNHVARLRGAIKLLLALQEEVREKGSNHFLICGHSHAGQLFALISQFLYNQRALEFLKEVLEMDNFSLSEIQQACQDVAATQIDFVAFGTPVRYGWAKGNYRLLHIINHRGPDHLAGFSSGMLTSRDGDYIQQWGIAGSDSLTLPPHEKRLNKKLNQILGTGYNRSIWWQNVRQRTRVHQDGKTLLVNYRDNDTILGGVINLFGHGIYTRFEMMEFNTSLIVQEFYSEPA